MNLSKFNTDMACFRNLFNKFILMKSKAKNIHCKVPKGTAFAFVSKLVLFKQIVCWKEFLFYTNIASVTTMIKRF